MHQLGMGCRNGLGWSDMEEERGGIEGGEMIMMKSCRIQEDNPRIHLLS